MIDKQELGETKVQRSGMKHWFWKAVDWVGDRVSEHPIVARIAYSSVMVMGAVSVLLEGHGWYASLGWFIAAAFMVLADMESEWWHKDNQECSKLRTLLEEVKRENWDLWEENYRLREQVSYGVDAKDTGV